MYQNLSLNIIIAQVLLDEKDKVSDHKVEGIPTKFIIDEKGKYCLHGGSNDLSLAIEAARE